jgi:uncharacterized membrane protein
MKINTVEDYIELLRKELAGSDRATIQDALYDAEEHLRSALEDAGGEGVLDTVIEEYGMPEEIAQAYRDVEARTQPMLFGTSKKGERGLLANFFGIFADPKAWGALLYMLISLITGTIYFCWAYIGVSVSVVFSLFIFGLPLAAFFVLSFRGVALVEGRIVEALLGVRMPRRPLFSPAEVDWRERLKRQLTDRSTWLILGYMILQQVLGVVYFSLVVIVLSLGLMMIVLPFLGDIFHLPFAIINGQAYFLPTSYFPLTIVLGIFIITGMMHMVKGIGVLHGKYSKFMLVS